jgi:hypothetical protein
VIFGGTYPMGRKPDVRHSLVGSTPSVSLPHVAPINLKPLAGVAIPVSPTLFTRADEVIG